MYQANKVKKKKNKCPYCGDSEINHTLVFIENSISPLFDSHISWATKHAPQFLKNFASSVPNFLFTGLSKIGLASFSSDIEKSKSFRSRVIWEEAERRGIKMEQVFLGKRGIDWYRAELGDKTIFFESIPVQPEYLDFKKDWDNKIILKKELARHSVPVPKFIKIFPIRLSSLEKKFSKLEKPIIVKPMLGSRARHTVTNINTFEEFKNALRLTRQISPYTIAEEHVDGYICRATLVGGKLAGFYSGEPPFIIGDGKNSIKYLIDLKNSKKENTRYNIRINDELKSHVSRLGYGLENILENNKRIYLSHRNGQLFGGYTKEMIDSLHPSFIPILEKAAKVIGLPVIGLDCLIPDPTKNESTQKWAIIECNTLPFIDMHYFALEGKPRNIAGMIWDMWQK